MFRKVMNKFFPRVILDKISLLHLLAPLKERTGDKKEIIDNGKFFVLSKILVMILYILLMNKKNNLLFPWK